MRSLFSAVREYQKIAKWSLKLCNIQRYRLYCQSLRGEEHDQIDEALRHMFMMVENGSSNAATVASKREVTWDLPKDATRVQSKLIRGQLRRCELSKFNDSHTKVRYSGSTNWPGFSLPTLLDEALSKTLLKKIIPESCIDYLHRKTFC